jgi:hypothetical protein
MKLSSFMNYIACYKGLNRSKLFVNALIDYGYKHPPGIPVKLFPGGMRRMKTLPVEVLKTEFHPLGMITLIHDRSDNLEFFNTWKECQSLLDQAEREYQSVDMNQVYIFLRSLKIDPDEYKYSL